MEPGESPVLAGGQPGAHKIEGIGIGYTPPMWDPALVNEFLSVPTADAKAMARRLAKEEGLFAGHLVGCERHGRHSARPSPWRRRTVATLLVDSGLKYLSTDVYRRHQHN